MLRAGRGSIRRLRHLLVVAVPYFTDRLDNLVEKYEGGIVHVEYIPGATGSDGKPTPIIIVYEVYPMTRVVYACTTYCPSLRRLSSACRSPPAPGRLTCEPAQHAD